jgi:hypothetical protein
MEIETTKDISVLDDKVKAIIDSMSREGMARLWRFAPLGEFPYIGEAGKYFIQRFEELGGWSAELSKKIGWEKKS